MVEVLDFIEANLPCVVLVTKVISRGDIVRNVDSLVLEHGLIQNSPVLKLHGYIIYALFGTLDSEVHSAELISTVIWVPCLVAINVNHLTVFKLKDYALHFIGVFGLLPIVIG